jgi:glycosyltransferase involved in cell wall biosynthesis
MLKRQHMIFLHDAQPFANPENFTFAFRTWYRLLFHMTGRASQTVFTNSQFSKSELVRYLHLSPQKIKVVLLGADHVLKVSPDEGILERHQLGKNTYVFAVASLNPNKNFSLVLRALALMGSEAPTCVIAGQRYDKVFGGIQLDESKVIHVGYVTDAELCALYSNAKALLFPSFYEGFGLPSVEAMLLGCPTIVSQTSVMPEINGDAALYCDPHSAQSLALALRQLDKNPHLGHKLRLKGHERATQFTWNSAAHTLLENIQLLQ